MVDLLRACPRLLGFAVLLLATALLPASALAQGASGTISGTASDSTGGVLPGEDREFLDGGARPGRDVVRDVGADEICGQRDLLGRCRLGPRQNPKGLRQNECDSARAV